MNARRRAPRIGRPSPMARSSMTPRRLSAFEVVTTLALEIRYRRRLMTKHEEVYEMPAITWNAVAIKE